MRTAARTSTATCTGLMPNTEYSIRVRATNAAGDGEWSDAVTETTMMAEPADADAAPSNVMASGRRTTWSPSPGSGGENADAFVRGDDPA